MPTFAVTTLLPDIYEESFLALIPRHRSLINCLLSESVIETYAVSTERRRGWVTVNGDDTWVVRAVVEQFSLYRYFHGIEIDELFIFDTVATRFPHISLNWNGLYRTPARRFIYFFTLMNFSFARRFGFFAFIVLVSGWLLTAGRPAGAPAISTEQLVVYMSSAIDNLRYLRCSVKAQERIGHEIKTSSSAMKLTFKPLQVYLKDNKNVEVLWVTGQNGGDAWVYPGSFPYVTLSLNPFGSLMRKGQHHTVLQAGFGTIAGLLHPNALYHDATFSRTFRYVGDTTVLGRPCFVLRSDFPQFRYVAYRAAKNETVATVAERFGCGEYRVLERNNLSPGDAVPEGKVVQVPNGYGRRTILCIDAKTYLPIVVDVRDDRGLFEKFEFYNVVPNQPIPLEEFTKSCKDYKL